VVSARLKVLLPEPGMPTRTTRRSGASESEGSGEARAVNGRRRADDEVMPGSIPVRILIVCAWPGVSSDWRDPAVLCGDCDGSPRARPPALLPLLCAQTALE
jgi:hypothetical protein